MDAPADGLYSRPPEVSDLVALCGSLNREGVRYVLIGGFAVIFHGFARTTKDIDLLIDPSDDNMHALRRAMAVLPDNAIALVGDGDVRQYRVVRVADEFVVDLMADACGVTYETAMAEGVDRFLVDEIEIPVASKAVLIRTKETFRDGDRADVRYLRLRLDEEQAPRS